MIFSYEGHKPEIHPTAFIHPTAEISGKVRIGARSSVWGGCVLRGDVDCIDIGDDVNIQDGSIIHTSHGFPTKIARAVTVGHRVMIHGATIEEECLIGMSATLLDGCVVKKNSFVGAGALVKEKGLVPEATLVIGMPAKPMRSLSLDEIQMIKTRAKEYVTLASAYQKAISDIQNAD